MEAEGEQAIKSYEEGALQEIKNMELRTKLLVNSKDPFLKKTLQDFMDIALKGAEAGSEFSIALKACLDGTYVPPPTPGADGNKTGSSAPSVCGSMMSCTSTSRRPPSSASSVRSLYSSHAVPHPPGSAHRSRSVVKTAASRVPGSNGMRRRSMSQPCSQKKMDYLSAHYKTPIITPKVHPSTTSTVLRLPKTGENLFSLGGSPVLANALASSSTAPQALIPLRDGRMLAVLPTEQNTVDHPMDFSPDTKRNLQLLRQNLNFLIKDD